MSQQPVVADVARDVTLECLDEAGHSHFIETVLGYHRPDPFAVTMTFLAADEPLTWTFGRDLLLAGLYSPAGDGDVHVAPAHNRADQPVLLVALCSPDGQLLLEADASEVSEFLGETLALVPQGSETANLDVDELISQLLG